MGLDSALGIASGSLANISLGLSVISQNVANATTLQYATETASQQSLSANGQDFGVKSGVVLRATDPALQTQLSSQAAQDAFSETTNNALSALQPVLGIVGESNDLGSQLTAMQASFSTLLGDPGDTSQQNAVVNSAHSLTNSITTLSQSYGQARQAAQDGLLDSVNQLQSALTTVGELSQQVVGLRALGQSTADLENQRAQAENSISQLVDTRFLDQANGDVTVLTAGGVQLPTAGAAAVTLANVTLSAAASYPANGVPGIKLGDTDITGLMTGGQIGAQLALRDRTLPTYQAGLDEFAHTLSTRFADQGLTLFTDNAGLVPVGTGTPAQAGYIGYAGVIQVNPAVTASPTLVRDGTQAVAGTATGASAFTPNSSGLDGFSTMIGRVLDYALGSQVQAGVAQPQINTQGLGATGLLNGGLGSQAALGDYASAFTTAQATDSATANTDASDSKAILTSLQSKMTGETGVSMDSELGQMVILQNAYGANAKIISAVQALYTETLAMVT